MKKILLTLGLFFAFSGAVQAKTPPEVLKPYKAYTSALKANDIDAARKHAFEAWQKAEELLGDSKTTGDLALNFAMIKPNDKKATVKQQEKAFGRALELVEFQENPALSYMERSIELMNFHQANADFRKSYKVAKNISNYAEDNSLTQSTFYAEALTTQAGYYASRRRSKRAEEIAVKALNAFEGAGDNILSAHSILASLYKGYALEGQHKSMEAALSYQQVMETLDGIDPKDHPLAAQALGRWSQMRSVLSAQGKLEEAEQNGLCQCWPYDKPRNDSIQPIKRVPPIMPSNAWVSGFTIVEFDIDDAGKPINEEILVSWPKGLYEKSSVKSLKKWEYTLRTKEETDSDRQDIVTTITYRLTDSSGNILY